MAWKPSNEDDLEQLFIDTSSDQPAAEPPQAAFHPTAYQAPPAQAPAAYIPIRQQRQQQATTSSYAPAGQELQYHENTVDESDFASFMREARAIGANLKLVCNPFINPAAVEAMLQQWDLWGPLIFTLVLACILSLENESDTPAVFTIVFIVVIVGAVLLTANVILLGGSVSFFQSISLLGYCMFPLDVAACLCTLAKHAAVRLPLIGLALAWAMRASIPFVAGSVKDDRRLLAVYPITLMYAVLGWLTYIN